MSERLVESKWQRANLKEKRQCNTKIVKEGGDNTVIKIPACPCKMTCISSITCSLWQICITVENK